MRQAFGYGRALQRCRAADTPWAVCDTRVTSTHCPGCGATKLVNTWTDTNRERAELAPDLARSAVHFHPDVKKRSIAVDVRDISPTGPGPAFRSPVLSTVFP